MIAVKWQRTMNRLAHPLTQFYVALLLALALIAYTSSPGQAQEESTIDLVAIDANIEGNEATTLGPLDGCISAEVGSEVTVDVIIDAVPEDSPMIGFQIVVTYDPEVLEATETDSEFLIASQDAYEPIEGLSDELPDSDGSLTIVVADIASDVDAGTSIESGSGVLTRITFMAVAEGTSEVAVGFDPPDAYPAIIDDENTILQVDNIGSALVAAGEECPPNAAPELTELPTIEELQPTPGPTLHPEDIPDPEGGGINTGLLLGAIAIVAGGVGAVGIGSALFLRRPRS